MITGCTFSVFSLILVFAGLGLDGAFYGVTNGLDSCINQKTGEYYGEEGLFSIYAECTGHSETCLCVNEQTSDKCYVFNIKEADNCGQILTRLPSLLMASVIFLTFLFVLVLAYSIFTCKMLCCKPALADDQAAVGASGADANATLTRV